MWSMIISNDVPGPKFPETPAFSNAFLSSSGITPPPTTSTSVIFFFFNSFTTLGK